MAAEEHHARRMEGIARHDDQFVLVDRVRTPQSIDRGQAKRVAFDCMVRHATPLKPTAHRRNFNDSHSAANPAADHSQGCLAEPKQLLGDRQPVDQHRVGLTIREDPRTRHQDAIGYGHDTYRMYGQLSRRHDMVPNEPCCGRDSQQQNPQPTP